MANGTTPTGNLLGIDELLQTVRSCSQKAFLSPILLFCMTSKWNARVLLFLCFLQSFSTRGVKIFCRKHKICLCDEIILSIYTDVSAFDRSTLVHLLKQKGTRCQGLLTSHSRRCLVSVRLSVWENIRRCLYSWASVAAGKQLFQETRLATRKQSTSPMSRRAR